MRRGPHLLVALSSHGYGHAAQTAPVVNALRRRVPGLRLTLRTTLPRAMLAGRFQGELQVSPEALDFGMVMASALTVRLAESARAYVELHRDWEKRVDAESQTLAALAPDLVLANIPYLALAAAARAGVPAVALCSLNWADIYRHYLGSRPEAAAIHGQMLAAYGSAAAFLQPTPAMPMPEIATGVPVGPIARKGRGRRAEIDRQLGAGAGERLVLAALGGVDTPLPMASWPHVPGLRFLVPQTWAIERPDVMVLESLGMPFEDLIASVDAVLTKPGYGIFAEAACNGTAVLYVSRPDWPEEPYLTSWLRRVARAQEIPPESLATGDIGKDLEALWGRKAPTRPEPAGVEEAAAYLARCLARG